MDEETKREGMKIISDLFKQDKTEEEIRKYFLNTYEITPEELDELFNDIPKSEPETESRYVGVRMSQKLFELIADNPSKRIRIAIRKQYGR